jgi:DNA-binding Lrp family transcriptional regulator
MAALSDEIDNYNAALSRWEQIKTALAEVESRDNDTMIKIRVMDLDDIDDFCVHLPQAVAKQVLYSAWECAEKALEEATRALHAAAGGMIGADTD